MPAAVGLGIIFAVLSVIVQLAIIIYFFLLFHRLIGTVEHIEQRCAAIETEVKILPH